jgi:hypothetical protein
MQSPNEMQFCIQHYPFIKVLKVLQNSASHIRILKIFTKISRSVILVSIIVIERYINKYDKHHKYIKYHEYIKYIKYQYLYKMFQMKKYIQIFPGQYLCEVTFMKTKNFK